MLLPELPEMDKRKKVVAASLRKLLSMLNAFANSASKCDPTLRNA